MNNTNGGSIINSIEGLYYDFEQDLSNKGQVPIGLYFTGVDYQNIFRRICTIGKVEFVETKNDALLVSAGVSNIPTTN